MLIDNEQRLKRLNRRSLFTLFLAWLALFLTVVGIAAGYKNWLRISDRSKLAIKQIKDINEQLPGLASRSDFSILQLNTQKRIEQNQQVLEVSMTELRNMKSQASHVADSLEQQVKTITQQQESVQTPIVFSSPGKNWLISEIEYYLRVANTRLQLHDDKAGALIAMKLADDVLLRNPAQSLLPLRQQIAQDIARLENYQPVDLVAISSLVDEMLDRIKITFEPEDGPVLDRNSLITDTQNPVGQTSNSTSEDDNRDVVQRNSGFVSKVKETLNKAVVVRKHDQTIQDELTADARENIKQLLELRLEAARIFALKREEVSYQQQLQRIDSQIHQYYPDDQAEELLALIAQLRQQKLQGEKPSLQALFEMVERLLAGLDISVDTSESGLN